MPQLAAFFSFKEPFSQAVLQGLRFRDTKTHLKRQTHVIELYFKFIFLHLPYTLSQSKEIIYTVSTIPLPVHSHIHPLPSPLPISSPFLSHTSQLSSSSAAALVAKI